MSQRQRSIAHLLGFLLTLLLAVVVIAPMTFEAEAGDEPTIYLPHVVTPIVFDVTPTAGMFNNVTDIAHAGDERLFVVERIGLIKILHPDGEVTTFLDLQEKVASDTGELGMFSLVFHPEYAENGRFFTTYTEAVGDKWDLRLVQFTVSGDPDVADPTSELELLHITQDFVIHNGGGLTYNPRDGHLYLGVGEDSQFLIAQDSSNSKGKVLKVAIDETAALARAGEPLRQLDAKTAVAPFVNVDRIASGFRNPWRLAVEPRSGDLFVGDVGDRTWEEINMIPYGFTGLNFGWPCMEGPDDRLEDPVCDRGFNPPIHFYSDGCSVIAGEFYYYENNLNQPTRLIFADGCSNVVQQLRPGPTAWYAEPVGQLADAPPGFITTFGSGVDGAIYVGFLGNSPLYKLTIPPLTD